MSQMRLVERMTGSPPNCFVCGQGNVEDEYGEVGPFIDFCREVNWGDDAYLCMRCAKTLALMIGFEDIESAEEKQRIIEAKNEEIHELRTQIDQARRKEREAVRDVQRIVKAKKTIKQRRAEAEKGEKVA